MELDINREINNKKRTNEEINTFMNEINSELEKNKEVEIKNELYNTVLKDVELASKYKEMLPEMIEQCLKDASYQRTFLYFDYNEKSKEYEFTCYEDGEKFECEKPSKEELEEFKEKGYTFYIPTSDGKNMRADDSLKEWVALEIDMILSEKDLANRRKGR